MLARHASTIHRFARRRCGHGEDARDVAQETMLAAARGLGEFRGQAALSTWLYAITRSQCSRLRRRSVFAPPAPGPTLDAAAVRDHLVDPAPRADVALARRELDHLVQRAIDQLEPGARDVLVLRDVEGLSAPEVGVALGLTVEAVKSRLHRARLAVRAALPAALVAGHGLDRASTG
ncbi:MAG: RNA polymerase sigma factor [Kofleriaceae bacterium]|nr:RNA polymerase sigma factor [Kofleriaceae bacterium]MBP6840185.1 RNA polymerase sigma factor [Kofleriaceae bacterium]